MAKQRKTTVVPRVRFPEFWEADGWEERVLGEEGEFLSSLTGKSAQHFGVGSAKYITYKNVFSNTFTDIDSLGAVDVGEHESQNAVEVGDVLFTVSSETPEEAGISSVVLDSIPDCYLNSFCTMFRYQEARRPNLHFLGYLLRQPVVRKYFAERAQGSTRFNLSKGVFRQLPLALPLPGEQQKIADCLRSLDEVIAAQGRKVEALKRYKRGLMQQLFPREGETVPRLRFPEFHDAPDWADEKLGKYVDIFSGGSPSSFTLSSNGTYPFVKVEDLNNCTKYQFTGREFAGDADGVVPKPSILFPKRGAAIELNKIRVTASEIQIDTNLMAISPKNGLTAEFLFYYLSNVGLAHIADTSTIPQINNKHIIPFAVRIPLPAEQQRIAECLSSLDDQIAVESAKLDALKTHKKGLMQQLFPPPEEV